MIVPIPVTYAPCHRGRHTQALVKPHKVIMREVQRHRSLQVFQLLAERVRKAREAAHAHPHRQVLALNKAGRDMGLIGPAGDNRALGIPHARRAVATGADRLCLVYFNYLAVIDICTERVFGRLHLGLESVR